MTEPSENQAGRRQRRHFDETHKRHAVELTLRRGDRSVRMIAEKLGVADSMLYEWRRLYAPKPAAAGPAPRSLEDAQEEITRLRAEVVRLRERETILKNHWASSPNRPGAVCPDRRDEKGEHAVDLLCEMIAQRGYYTTPFWAPRWRKRIVVPVAPMTRRA